MTKKKIVKGYHLQLIICPGIDKKIKLQVWQKMSRAEKAKKGLREFVPEDRRWIGERSNGWVERWKSLVKNSEKTLKYAQKKLSLCFTHLMVIRLAAS